MLHSSNETASVLTRCSSLFPKYKKTMRDKGVMMSAIEQSELEQLLTIPEVEFGDSSLIHRSGGTSICVQKESAFKGM